MKLTTPDVIDWAGALQAAADQARELREGPTLGPKARCLCGSDDTRGAILAEPVDLTAATDDLSVQRNEGGRPCMACQHYIHHGAMCVRRHFGPTTTVRDHFHPECVRL